MLVQKDETKQYLEFSEDQSTKVIQKRLKKGVVVVIKCAFRKTINRMIMLLSFVGVNYSNRLSNVTLSLHF